MNVFDALKNNPAFREVCGEGKDGNGPPLDEPSEQAETGADKEALVRERAERPVIEVIPPGRRKEAQAILDEDPNAIFILQMCKWGVYDRYTAMERLGMPDPFRPE